MLSVTERFLNYVKIDTQSREESSTSPSTLKQHELAELLVSELKEIGAEEITYDREHCYVYASVPASKGMEDKPVLGFIAHMDTSPAVSGQNVKPQMIRNYDGGDILLNKEQNIVMRTADFPELTDYVGKNLIVTDGTTLLGADDKAGVAEIMTMADYLLSHTEIPHGKIRIAFTPDEEIGAGTDYFDVNLLGADYAYTVDGGKLGELEYENFNAAGGKVVFNGRSVHPGDAKNKMINALLVAMEFQSMLPIEQNPMYTEGYEGFFHLDHVEGTVEKVQSAYIIRDHDRKKFEQKKQLFLKIGDFLNEKYGPGTVEILLEDSYYNMREIIEQHMYLIDHAKAVMQENGVKPLIVPIRGGTDGARLSFMGLPCPNLCTGGHNFHGRFEYICIESMDKVVDILIGLVSTFSADSKSISK